MRRLTLKNFYRDRGLIAAVILLIAGSAVLLVHMYSADNTVFWIAAPIGVFICAFAVGKLIQVTRSVFQYYRYIDEGIDEANRLSLSAFPIPVVIVDDSRSIVWSNKAFDKDFFEVDAYTNTLDFVTDKSVESLLGANGMIIDYREKFYKTFARRASSDVNNTMAIIYFEDVTELCKLQEEYKISRPVVMVVVIDSFDELMSSGLESEKARLSVQIDKLLEQFIGETTGIMRKMKSDRFLFIIEERHISKIIEQRVKILDKAREIIIKDRHTVTLSIGIGRTGKNLIESEQFARQALDMAQGRGGDQAAVKTETGYEFYGGVSKGIERQTKVKTRIIASAIKELIDASANVYIMGHKFGDLDSVGSAIGMAATVERLGKPTKIVVDYGKNLAQAVLDKIVAKRGNDLFVSPAEVRGRATDDDLLIIVDTHNPEILEDKDFYKSCKRVVVIDHHRKMVSHIDNALIFYHEPYSSSASEMVTELVQYYGDAGKLSPLEAESLLAGITLDTKNFVMRTGVRTFEAAAYLRKMGADTIAVRELFAGSIESYQRKTKLVSTAEIYRKCAIAACDFNSDDLRVVAPQAADELLGISGVAASFALYKTATGKVSISARSMGRINVQLIMEGLGGGGHQTMAGAQLENTTVEKAKQLLTKEIDAYYDTLSVAE